MTPDRVDRLVRKEFDRWVYGFPHFTAESVAATLLRRERASVRRKVQGMARPGANTFDDEMWVSLNDLLAWLKRR